MRIKTRKYIDKQVKWIVKFYNAEVISIRRAVDKVEDTNKEATNKLEKNQADYRAQQNEWRGQSKDREGSFVTRKELAWAVVAIIGLLLTAISLIFK